MKIVANEDILIEINSKIILRTTRMHSSRMRTARSSSRLLGEGVSASVLLGYSPLAWAWTPPLGCGP